MKSYENLLLTTMEECAEVSLACSELSQFCSEILRFGFKNHNCMKPEEKLTEQEILEEFYQLFAMIEHCQEENILPILSNEEIHNIKINKIFIMSDENPLLTTIEACAEVSLTCSKLSQTISKALRFGLKNHNCMKLEEINEQKILKEFFQLCAIIELCQKENILPSLSDKEIDKIKTDKVHKVEHYQKISKIEGCLEN